MANRPAETQKYNLRPSIKLVETLSRLAPKCGLTTGNELAVELLECGVRLLEDPADSPSLPGALAVMRGLLHGRSTAADLERPMTEERVRDIVRRMLLDRAPEAAASPGSKAQTEPKSKAGAKPKTSVRTPSAKGKPSKRRGG